MNTLKITTILFIAMQLLIANAQADNNRMIILADMGNEPDEEQQMVHMLVCSNEFDLEGLIAVTGKFLNPNSNNPDKQRLYPELFYALIDGYGNVYHNLLLHSPNYPTPNFLKSIVATGQKGYGIDDVGEGKSSAGSQLIAKALLKNDERPLYIVVNAGSNTLAQALWDLNKQKSASEMQAIIAKLRVFENGAQDNAGAWICSKFPNIHWIRSNYQTYCYAGPGVDGGFNNKGNALELGPYTWKPYQYSGIGQHQWALENIKGNHGELGKEWPIRQFRRGGISFMEGGGTIPFLALVNKGLHDINNPHWGGWSGRYSTEKQENYYSKHQSVKKDEGKFTPFLMFTEEAEDWYDTTRDIGYEQSIYAPVWRWRQAFFNDFKCRMDWCNSSFDAANHHPVAVINNDSSNNVITFKVNAGKTLKLTAENSFDPDNDPLFYKWWVYNEAGTYSKPLKFTSVENTVNFSVPNNATGTEIHLILEINDNNPIAHLFDYRRIIIQVN